MKIAICIGHSRKGDQGAVSAGGISEFIFNLNLGEQIRRRLLAAGIPCEVEGYYAGNTYSWAMRWLSALLKAKNFTHAIELHFNAASPAAKGHEFLHHRSSTNGRKLAQCLADSFQESFPNSTPRDGGVKAIPKGGRGELFVSLTHCPAVLCEPFFGTNPAEWAQFSTPTGQANLAQALAQGIAAHLGKPLP